MKNEPLRERRIPPPSKAQASAANRHPEAKPPSSRGEATVIQRRSHRHPEAKPKDLKAIAN